MTEIAVSLADEQARALVRHMRERIFTALDALEDRDQPLAVAALLSAVEDGPVVDGQRHCPHCSFIGPPGLLEHHLFLSHGLDWDTTEELVRRAA